MIIPSSLIKRDKLLLIQTVMNESTNSMQQFYGKYAVIYIFEEHLSFILGFVSDGHKLAPQDDWPCVILNAVKMSLNVPCNVSRFSLHHITASVECSVDLPSHLTFGFIH